MGTKVQLWEPADDIVGGWGEGGRVRPLSKAVCKLHLLLYHNLLPERIRAKDRTCRICTSHFMGVVVLCGDNIRLSELPTSPIVTALGSEPLFINSYSPPPPPYELAKRLVPLGQPVLGSIGFKQIKCAACLHTTSFI